MTTLSDIDVRDTLAVLERYYDTVPRATCDIEEVGPLSLFVARHGYPYYGRPRLGLADEVTTPDVVRLLERQRELGVPESIEWVHETTPSLLAAARDAGMSVAECPLLVLGAEPAARAAPAVVRLLSADDPQLGAVRAAINVGFAHSGTGVGEAGVAERDAELAARPEAAARAATLAREGLTVLAGAFDAQAGAVGGGSHNPRGTVTELVGIGVLPAYRRRGIAAALTALLARDALDHGATTVFCSAEGDAVARVYESVGFRRVGTACIAETG